MTTTGSMRNVMPRSGYGWRPQGHDDPARKHGGRRARPARAAASREAPGSGPAPACRRTRRRGWPAQVAHRLPRLARRAADVRQQHDVVHREQRRRDVRLVGEDVEPGGLDRARLQRRDQRRLVDDRAARDVDRACPSAPSAASTFGVDEVAASPAPPGQATTRKSTSAASARRSGTKRYGTSLRLARRCTRCSCPSPRGALRDRLADAAEAQDADASCRRAWS